MIPAAEIEAVARAACTEMGLDADERGELYVLYDDVAMHGKARPLRASWKPMNHWFPAWMWFARDAERAIAFHRAIEAVKEAGK